MAPIQLDRARSRIEQGGAPLEKHGFYCMDCTWWLEKHDFYCMDRTWPLESQIAPARKASGATTRALAIDRLRFRLDVCSMWASFCFDFRPSRTSTAAPYEKGPTCDPYCKNAYETHVGHPSNDPKIDRKSLQGVRAKRVAKKLLKLAVLCTPGRPGCFDLAVLGALVGSIWVP